MPGKMRKAKFARIGFSLGLATLTAVGTPLMRLSLLGMGAIATFHPLAPAEAATLTHWQFDPSTRELRVTVPEGTTPRYFLLAQPPRIVLDLPNTQVGTVPEQQAYSGLVRQIRVGQFQPGLTRIVIELSANAEFAPGQVELRQEGDRWVLRPLLTDAATVPDVASAPTQPAPVSPSPLPEVEPSAATPDPLPEPAAIAPSAPQPESTAELGSLPQLSPAPPAVPDVLEFEADSEAEAEALVTPVAPEESLETTPPAPDTISEPVLETTPETSADETTADVLPADLPSDSLPLDSPAADSPAADSPAADSPAADSPAADSLSVDLPSADSPSADSPSADLSLSDSPSADLPPLEPGALEIPVEPASEVPETLELVPPPAAELAAEPTPAQVELEAVERDFPADSQVLPDTGDAAAQPDPAQAGEAIALEPEQASEAIAPEPEEQAPEAIAPETELAPEAIAPVPQVPTALPPATFSTSPSVTVTVPPLGDAPSAPLVNEPDNAPVAPTTPPAPEPVALPPATFLPNQTGQVSVPPVSTIPDPTAAPVATSENAVEFGQPISEQAAAPPPASTPSPQNNFPDNSLPESNQPPQPNRPDQSVAVAPTPPNVLLPSGTVLSLRYPGETSLSLESGLARQEVLLLDQPVRDRSGNVIAAAGGQVIGRFETGSRGSQFIAQAITLQGQNVLLTAESGILAGDRDVSDQSLLQNSALGALALTVLGGFTGIGLLGGLAAGATATYLTAPQPAIIQPNQIVEVRLTEDLPQPF
jgi:hypothetical protein